MEEKKPKAEKPFMTSTPIYSDTRNKLREIAHHQDRKIHVVIRRMVDKEHAETFRG